MRHFRKGHSNLQFRKKTALNLVPGDGGDGALQQRGAGASARPPRGGGVAQLLGGHPLPRPKRPMLQCVESWAQLVRNSKLITVNCCRKEVIDCKEVQ